MWYQADDLFDHHNSISFAIFIVDEIMHNWWFKPIKKSKLLPSLQEKKELLMSDDAVGGGITEGLPKSGKQSQG